MATTGLFEPVAPKAGGSVPSPRHTARGESSAADLIHPTPHNARIPTLRTGALVERTDRELIRLSLSGDDDAYGELVCRYQPGVRQLARGMVNDYQTSEDLAQEAFIRAYHSLGSLKDPDRFGAWVCAILRRTGLDHLRLTKPTVSLETLQEEGFEPPQADREENREALEDREEDARVLEALRNLREDYRDIIILKHVEKLSYKELASRLNMSVSAVGEKLSRVRALLKRRLEKKPIKP